LSERIAPEILPPAFFSVSLNLVGRRCVVIGADREADEKSADLRAAGADVLEVRDPAQLRDRDVDDAFLVISTPQDAALSARLRALADRRRFLLCTIDQPAYGFVAMQATVRSGRARIGISTGGVAPRIGGVLRAALQDALDATFARFLECLAHQRRRVRAAHATSEARRAAMTAAAEGFEVEVRLTYPQWFRDELAELAPKIVS
jgi:precorrin-2 dehydrogenase / sirohydrochlorin ferrochelatase